MYCTISSEPLSTTLGDDERLAFAHFRREARALGSISSSFDALAHSATSAYDAALTRPQAERWATLVACTAALVQSARALEGIVRFDGREREALEFFEAIVRENADLLVAPPFRPLGSARTGFGIGGR